MPILDQWSAPVAQQLVRYEALVQLLEDIQSVNDIAEIARRAATKWKYFANVACFHIVVADGDAYLVIDGFRGEATVVETAALSAWDEHHWTLLRPALLHPDAAWDGTRVPEHLARRGVVEIQVLPVVRAGQCLALISLAARHEPFNELDNKFIRLFGGQLAERIFHIRAHRRADSERRESESRYRSLAENSADWIWAIDVDGRPTYTNDRGLKLLGMTREQYFATDASLLVHPDDLAKFSEILAQSIAQHRGWCNSLVRWRTADGSFRAFESNASPMFDEDGQLVGFQGVDRDVSERIAAEAELTRHRDHLGELVAARTADLSLAKEAAESASRAKSTFLRNMSHELRTPMNAIIGMTSLVLRKIADPKLRDQLGKVMQSSEKLLGVINDILDISRIEADRLTLNPCDFSLGDVLDNLANVVATGAMEKGLTFQLDVPDDLAALRLWGDSLRLGQILLNFAENAVKFTQQGGVALRVRREFSTPEGVQLKFEVADSGIGISDDDQQRLFTAFEQADGSMTRKYGGTGLGLAISKRLAELMGGSVSVDSELGVGSTFSLIVLFARAVVTTHPGGLPSGATLPNDAPVCFSGLLLLAEDEPINQEVSRELLEEAGFTVDVAGNGIEAVEAAQLKQYDLILMDMQMPKLHGVEAARRIRELPGYADTPILALTANAFDEDREACLAAGMNDHIAKPIVPVDLFDRLAKWLGRTRDQSTHPRS